MKVLESTFLSRTSVIAEKNDVIMITPTPGPHFISRFQLIQNVLTIIGIIRPESGAGFYSNGTSGYVNPNDGVAYIFGFFEVEHFALGLRVIKVRRKKGNENGYEEEGKPDGCAVQEIVGKVRH